MHFVDMLNIPVDSSISIQGKVVERTTAYLFNYNFWFRTKGRYWWSPSVTILNSLPLVHIRVADPVWYWPGPDPRIFKDRIRIQKNLKSGSGSRQKHRIRPDPDPQPWPVGICALSKGHRQERKQINFIASLLSGISKFARFFFWLKGQVTFLKLCLLVVCLALIIPRFTLFWLTTVFRPKNAFICLCQRSLFLLA